MFPPAQKLSRIALVLLRFPNGSGPGKGMLSLMEPEVERGLVGLDDYMLSDYKGTDGKAINFYVAYYPSQRKGESPHSPIVCIPGDGWQITRIERTHYAETVRNSP